MRIALLPVLFLATVLLPIDASAEDMPTQVWAKNYNVVEDDWGEDVAVDASGNVYVTGNVVYSVYHDWLTIKYDADGNLAWTAAFDSGNDTTDAVDTVCGLDVDDQGNVYVAGYSPGMFHVEWRLIKYDTNGNEIWNAVYTPPSGSTDAGAHSIDVSGDRIYVTGDVLGTSFDFLTIAYSLDGAIIWQKTHDTGNANENAWAATADPNGGVYVSGNVWQATTDWQTIRYDADGNEVWVATFDSGTNDFQASDAIAVDAEDNVYVGGWTENATTDWQIVKYDSNGAEVWVRTTDEGLNEGVWGLAVDQQNNLYVHGDVDTGSGWDYRTVKYDPAGVILWDLYSDFGDGLNNGGRGMVIDDDGFVYLTGHRDNGNNADYWTVKYQQHPPVVDAGPGVDAATGTDAGQGADAATGPDAGAGTDAGAGADAATGSDASTGGGSDDADDTTEEGGCGCSARGEARHAAIVAGLLGLLLHLRRRRRR